MNAGLRIRNKQEFHHVTLIVFKRNHEAWNFHGLAIQGFQFLGAMASDVIHLAEKSPVNFCTGKLCRLAAHVLIDHGAEDHGQDENATQNPILHISLLKTRAILKAIALPLLSASDITSFAYLEARTKGQKFMSEKLQRVRGTRDLLPEDSLVFRFVEESAYEKALLYGFGEIETPIFEFSDVFHRTLGETSDVVNKETYDFTDRGGESLTLRPEGTAGVARAFISEGMSHNLPLKFYYSGPMFRYERPQKGRYRQFYQLGAECLGYESPLADVECIGFAWDLLQKIGISADCTLEINTLGDTESRAAYREALVQYFTAHQDQLSADSKMRLEKNPLRILDSKDEGDKKLNANAPKLEQYLNETSQTFFKKVLAGIERLGIPYQVNSHLVRGLDYYCHTVFEFTTSKLGAQGTVLAGGRYDGLIETMGGSKTPGVGWAAGIDRLADLTPKELTTKKDVLIAVIGADDQGEDEGVKVAHELRSRNLKVENILSGKMGKKMQKANKLGAHYALILGGSEVENKQVTIKNFGSGEQTTIARADLATYKFTAP